MVNISRLISVCDKVEIVKKPKGKGFSEYDLDMALLDRKHQIKSTTKPVIRRKRLMKKIEKQSFKV